MTVALAGHYPTREAVEDLIRGGIARFRSAVETSGNYAERHNAFTDHCLALLFCSTGHRPVNDPFQSLKLFDLDRKLLLVSDKVTSESRAWRMCALPEIAAKQVQAYVDYLPKLAARLSEDPRSRQLASEIKLLVKGSDVLPLYFYMDEQIQGSTRHISVSEMSRRWQEWALPVNFLRHVTATELIRESGRADWAQMQLGHMDGVDHPLGRTSTKSTLSTLEEVGTCLHLCMKALKWQHLEFPIRVTSSGYIASDKKLVVGKKTLHGHQKRAADRAQDNARVLKLINSVLIKALDNRPLNSIGADEFNLILNDIIAGALDQDLAPNRCLRLVNRYLRSQKGGLSLLRRVARIRHIEPEPSPFYAELLEDFRICNTVHESFLQHLSDQGRLKSSPSCEQRIAEIVTSAALFGGIANKSRLKALSGILLQNVFRFGDELFVDIPLNDEKSPPVFRWFPDPVSRSLIIGLYRSSKAERTLKVKKLMSCLKAIVSDISSNVGEPLANLAQISSTELTLKAPGYLAAILRGDIPAVSLPLPQFVRVVTERALRLASDEKVEASPEKEVAAENWSPRLPAGEKAKYSAQEAVLFKELLRKAFSDSRNIPVVGNLKPRNKRKASLVASLKREFRYSGEWSSFPVTVVAWLVHLCEFGTRIKKNIAYATVENYTGLIFRELSRHLYGHDFISLSDIEYEDVYIRALDSVAEHRRFKLAYLLREFHLFLIEKFEVDSLDWSAVMAASGAIPVASYADANLVTNQEYTQAIASIRNDNSLPARTRTQYAALVLFGYRFGLRFGEALRLQYRDIQYDSSAGEMYVLVHNSRYGEVKTQSGVRIVSLLEQLQPDETLILEEILDLAADGFAEDPGIPLMAESGVSKVLIERHVAAGYVNSLLKKLTGDVSLRYHHLRHSWATRLVAHQYFSGSNDLDGIVRAFCPDTLVDEEWERFVGMGPVVYPLRSIMVAIGHATEATTLGSYSHCADQIAGSVFNSLAPELSDYAEAYCQRIDRATLSKRRSKKSPGCEGWSSLALRGVDIHEPPIPTVNRNLGCNAAQTDVNENAAIKLVDIEKLLRRNRVSRWDVGRLSRSFLISPDAVQEVLELAVQVERESGCICYLRDEMVDDPIFSSGGQSDSVGRFALRENTRVTDILSRLDQRLASFTQDQVHDLSAGLKVWCKTHNHQSALNVIAEISELKRLLIAFGLLGLGLEPKLKIPLGDQSSELKEQLVQLGLPITVGSIPYAAEKTTKRRRGRVAVLVPKNDETVTAQTLQRVLFVLSVAMLR